jgi:DHA1 family bicyclomycin/chloramphenicol resistance-like MFS transporter
MDKKKLYLILILGLLSAIGPLSIDMYLPAFPDIAKGLHTSVSSVMLSLSSFFIGISVGQLNTDHYWSGLEGKNHCILA